MADFFSSCPAPIVRHDTVQLAHGGGGRLMHQLIERVFMAAFANPLLETRHDAAVLDVGGDGLAFTTDSYVVRPLFFPGGDIGTLAVNGTVNDLAMAGAVPRYLSAGFIIEEGLPIATLEQVAASMRRAAAEAGVAIVTGDTKVVDRGKGDGLFINTAGVGQVQKRGIGPSAVREGDAVVVSGDIGRHGMAVMAVREGLEFQGTIESDCAPVAAPVLELLRAGLDVHCLRDLTRGGLASALNEIAGCSRLGISIEETRVPVRDDVRAACEILGLDPLYVANEGRFVAFVPGEQAGRAIEILHGHDVSRGAALIGRVVGDPIAPVVIRGPIGATRVLDLLTGEQLPRIC